MHESNKLLFSEAFQKKFSLVKLTDSLVQHVCFGH